jgi:FixJ family two-component response regulator
VVQRMLVSVVDDDESVRESLPAFLRLSGFEVRTFSSAEEFLASDYMWRTGCLILDVAMPNMSGPELQQELARLGCSVPIVFITARPDDRLRATVLDRGAVAYLTKPFDEAGIVEAINTAFEKK